MPQYIAGEEAAHILGSNGWSFELGKPAGEKVFLLRRWGAKPFHRKVNSREKVLLTPLIQLIE